MEIKTYAPVVIPTLCRYDTFSRCVNSLSKCTGADQTELFIGIDYPAKEEHWEGYCKICSCADQLQGFKAVHIYKRETNYGQKKNTKSLLEEIKSRFDRYILSPSEELGMQYRYTRKLLEKCDRRFRRLLPGALLSGIVLDEEEGFHHAAELP